MNFLIWLAVLIGLAGMMVVVPIGWRGITRKIDSLDRSDVTWPTVALIVPATGEDSSQIDCFHSLLTQDYPSYHVILVTQSVDDPATRIVESILSGQTRASHVISGLASRCSQKNHNLLAGLTAIDPRTEILAFCDSTRVAPKDWLTCLVRPLLNPRNRVSAGYHYIRPLEGGLWTFCRVLNVLGMHLLTACPWFTQTWGGSTAIRREVFDSLNMRELWAETVVDDVTLAARLKQAGMRVAYASGACLDTPLGPTSLADWNSWFIRQWIYLKFYFPGSWAAGGLFAYLMTGLVLWSIMVVLAGPLGMADPTHWWPAATFLSILMLAGQALRLLHPGPGPGSWFKWPAVVFLNLLMAGVCHLQTVFTWKVHWRGVCYHVTWRGRVSAILRRIST